MPGPPQFYRYVCATALLLGLGLAGSVLAQKPKRRPAGPVWLTPAALTDSLRQRPRPVLVFIGTSWCGYCRLQEATTFRHPAVLARLQAGYYCVHLDAESREPLVWAGRRYEFQPTGPGTGTHALALALGTDGTVPLSYPTTVLLDADLHVRGRWAGLLRPPELLSVLNTR